MRISDWSSDVCSSDLPGRERQLHAVAGGRHEQALPDPPGHHQQAGAVSPRRPARGDTVEVGRRTELVEPADEGILGNSSEQLRVRKWSVSTCSYRVSLYTLTKQTNYTILHVKQ